MYGGHVTVEHARALKLLPHQKIKVNFRLVVRDGRLDTPCVVNIVLGGERLDAFKGVQGAKAGDQDGRVRLDGHLREVAQRDALRWLRAAEAVVVEVGEGGGVVFGGGNPGRVSLTFSCADSSWCR